MVISLCFAQDWREGDLESTTDTTSKFFSNQYYNSYLLVQILTDDFHNEKSTLDE